MKKKLQISISNPCHEKWSSFIPTAQGGFCSGCRKEVIDFTNWSEDLIKAYFKHHPTDTCGRFRREQLKVYDIDGRQTSFINRITTFLMAALFVLSSRDVTAQGSKKPKYQTELFQSEKTLSTNSSPQTQKTIRGSVKDKDRIPLPGVNVLRKGTSLGTVTDADGRFSLTIDNPDSTEVLQFSFVGFETVEYTISGNHAEIHVAIELSDYAMVLGGAMTGGISYRWFTPRGLWWRIKSLFW